MSRLRITAKSPQTLTESKGLWKSMSQKLYVLVRKDLSKSQQAVQAGHAVAEFLLRGPSTFWGNGTLVYLGTRNETDLKWWSD